MPIHSEDSGKPNAEALFAAWLIGHDAGEAADFELYCREHPAAEGELRLLHDAWARMEAALRHHGLTGSLSEKLEAQYGGGVDPCVTLEGEETVKGALSSAVLSRLAGRGPASTRYRIKGEVGHGGMGAVLRVWDEDLRRHLAMKVMLGNPVASERGGTPQVDPRLLGRFLEEAQVTGQLDHPGIVPVHELGLDAGGRVYFTMKLVKGQTLKEVFDELARGAGAWTQTRVLGSILKVCEAMSYAHAKGVIHRDLKPANVMVGKFGEVYVMDWGLAKILGREDQRDLRPRERPDMPTSEVGLERSEHVGGMPDSPLYTMDGDILGTPAYMPPEQARGDRSSMGPHSDVYAVGAMLYQLFAGHMPYVRPGVRINNFAVWRKVQGGPPTALHDLDSKQPAELVAICERAMARDVGLRYPDMSAMAEDLAAYLEGRVVKTYETGAWAEARKWMRRNRALAASLAALMAALASGLIISWILFARAESNAQRASAGETLALLQRSLAVDAYGRVSMLSAIRDLDDLRATADGLWPPSAENISSYESWIARASQLARRLDNVGESDPELLDRLDVLRRSLPPDHPEVLGAELEVEARRTPSLRAELADLEDTLGPDQHESEHLTQVQSNTRWRHSILTNLIRGLEDLSDPTTGLLAADGVAPSHGWSVPKRLAFARRLQVGFAADGEFGLRWAEALPAIHDAYPGLELKAQVGLVPIGPDPRSGLWEFAHLMSGEPAERALDGAIVLTEQTGVVLVLLPSASFWMGAQSGDPSGQNHDPLAQGDERPVHEVGVSAFFMSKYELTQGQWLRLTGNNPSFYQQSGLAPTLLHPVEQVSWMDCMKWLPRAGLSLPSEAQWEFAARGGTDSAWWTGSDRESLRGKRAANLADQAAARAGGDWQDIKDWPELDDGFAVHAPIDGFAANGFGLYGVAGNLCEWCLDGYDVAFYGKSPMEDPLAPEEGATHRVARGGSYFSSASLARSASRYHDQPSNADGLLGVRPARAIDQ